MNWRITLGLVLLAAAAISGWSLWRNRVVEEEARTASGRSEYVLREFELIALDKSGKESFTLRAPLLRETPGASTMELTTPVFLLPDSDQPGQYWDVRSKTGWVSEARDEIRLRGDVVAQGPKQAVRPVTMETQELNVFPDTNRATSDAAVSIAQPGLTMQGRGLQADLDTRRFTLKSQARTRYAPSRR